jgi:N-acetylmuramoyl-L-alanine amidase
MEGFLGFFEESTENTGFSADSPYFPMEIGRFFALLILCQICKIEVKEVLFMKRLICILTAVTICLSFLPAKAAGTGAEVVLDGTPLSKRAILQGGSSFIPLRELCSRLGARVVWRDSDKSVLIEGNGVSARLKAGSSNAESGGKVSLGGKCMIKNGVFYAPARGLAKLLSLSVDWNANARRVIFSTSASYNSDEVLWLARIINAEAGGESFDGQIAVGNVILNRVESPDFPNTIYGVIFDRNFGVQFTPTANGTIYNTPSEQSIKAAKLCLSGYEVAPECLYFFNPKLSTAHYWIMNNRKFCKIIGNHHFYD